MFFKQGHHLLRGQGLNQPGFRLNVMLAGVIQLQLVKRIGLLLAGQLHLTAEQGRRHQVAAMARLHHMG